MEQTSATLKGPHIDGAPVDAATPVGLDGPLDPARAGAKAATLAVLRAAGLPVPPGVVVPPGADPDLAGRHVVDALGDGPLAVRSSAPAEDGAERSFAGMFVTTLGVQGAADVAAAVRRTRESLTSARAAAYAGADGAQDARATGMPVLVMPLVDARWAGVAFTVDPLTGDRSRCVVEVVAGLGESLADGSATPQRWHVDGAGARAVDGPDVGVPAPLVTAVAGLARRAEDVLGGPQDVEWAVGPDGPVVLQARPVTGRPGPRDGTAGPGPVAPPGVVPVPLHDEPPPGFWIRDSTHFPLPCTPFTAAVFSPERTGPHIRQLCRDLGVLFEDFPMRNINGWTYGSLVPLGGRTPPPLPAWATWVAMRAVPMLRRRTALAEAALREDRSAQLLHRWSTQWRPAQVEQVARLRDTDLGGLDDDALAAYLEDALTALDTGLHAHYRSHGAIWLALADLAFLCRDELGWGDAETLELLAGLSEATSETARGVARLAAVPPGPAFEEALSEFLRTSGCRALRYEVGEDTLAERPELVRALVEDQRRHPDGGAAQARLDAVRRAREAIALDRLSGAARERFERALARARRAYPVRDDNEYWTISAPLALLRWGALEAGRRLVARGTLDSPDDAVFLRPEELLALLRTETRDGDDGDDGDAGAPAGRRGGTPGDDPASVPADARAAVLRRRGERLWALGHPGPYSYGEPPPVPSLAPLPAPLRRTMEAFLWNFERLLGGDEPTEPADPSTVRGRVVLHGVAASAGTYTGPVRVVRDESQLHRVRPGDVLVCRMTAPVWSVVFGSVGALVTDTGGTLSHAAIIAREFGIAAVVATREATTRLADGDVVTVDGTAGVVTRTAEGGLVPG